MIRLVAEAWIALGGLYRLMRFRDEWEIAFDVSAAGFWRSFGAAFVSLPFIVLILAGAWYADPQQFRLAPFMVSYLLSWIAFPVAAWIALAIQGLPQRFVPWVVLHNWVVVPLYGAQAAVMTLYVAGIFNIAMVGFCFLLYDYVRVLAHWRVAYAATGLPTVTSGLVAAVPLLFGHLVMVAVSRLLTAGG